MEVRNNSVTQQALNMIRSASTASSATSQMVNRSEESQAVTSSSTSVNSSVSNTTETRRATSSSTANHTNNLLRSIEENETVSDETLYRSIEAANRVMFSTDRRLEHEVHEITNTVMVRVIDSNTDEIIRELPPQSRLDALAKVWQMVGIIVDDAI